MADSGVVFNDFPEISNRLYTALKRVVKKTAFEIQKDAMVLAPVDTGFLRASIYTVTSESSSYGQGKYGTGGKRGKFNAYKILRQESLPEVEPPSDDFTAYVAVAASYGIYIEMGTRFMNAQPYFQPAVDMNQALFEAALGAIESQLGGS